MLHVKNISVKHISNTPNFSLMQSRKQWFPAKDVFFVPTCDVRSVEYEHLYKLFESSSPSVSQQGGDGITQ